MECTIKSEVEENDVSIGNQEAIQVKEELCGATPECAVPSIKISDDEDEPEDDTESGHGGSSILDFSQLPDQPTGYFTDGVEYVEVPVGERLLKCKIKKTKGWKRCPFCKYGWLTMSSLLEHIAKKHPDIIYCNYPDCDFFCGSRKMFLFHVRKHTTSPATCTICGETFFNKGGLRQHLHSHDTSLPHPCSRCDHVAMCRYDLRQHWKKNHLQEGKYRCDQCNNSFTNICYLTMHIIFYHTNTGDYKCSSCDFSSTAHILWRYHVRYQHEYESGVRVIKQRRLLQCPYCPVRKKAMALKMHMCLTHSIERQVACPYCPFRFFHKYSYERHLVEHIDFKCRSCKFFTKDLEELHVHFQKKHNSSIESFVCFICGLPCSDIVSFKDHVVKHRGAGHQLFFIENYCKLKYPLSVDTSEETKIKGYEYNIQLDEVNSGPCRVFSGPREYNSEGTDETSADVTGCNVDGSTDEVHIKVEPDICMEHYSHEENRESDLGPPSDLYHTDSSMRAGNPYSGSTLPNNPNHTSVDDESTEEVHIKVEPDICMEQYLHEEEDQDPGEDHPIDLCHTDSSMGSSNLDSASTLPNNLTDSVAVDPSQEVHIKVEPDICMEQYLLEEIDSDDQDKPIDLSTPRS